MVEGARLEIAYTATYRGFESHPLRHKVMSFDPSPEETERARIVLANLLDHIRRGETIRLPDFGDNQESPFSGTVDSFQYQFEGEEDLLHLVVTKVDSSTLTPEEGLAVARFLMPDVPPALVWLKPGEFSQHLYVGHDDLLP